MSYVQIIRYLFPILLIGFTFYKAKFYGSNSFNENAYSLNQSKAIQGFAALAIMFHHMAQHTCAPWLMGPRIEGLEPFLNIGYLMVGIFFFASGFGLYKSAKSKADYFKHFFAKRFLPLIYFYAITNVLTLILLKKLSPYTWFVYAIAVAYIGFFLAFRFIKNDHIAVICTALVSLGYVYVVDFVIGYETYWFNSSLVFVSGIVFAMYEKKIMAFTKKCYWIILILLTAGVIFSFVQAIKMDEILSSSFESYNDPALKLKTALVQTLAALICVLWVIAINLKVEFRNGLLNKMGNITLGFYLIHPFFCDLFCWDTLFPKYKDYLYIKNIPLYTVAVFVASMVVTIICYKLFDLLKKFFGRKKCQNQMDAQQ